MSFQRLYKVIQDSPVGFETVNSLAANQADMRTQMFVEHGSNEFLSKGLALGGNNPPPDWAKKGRHNLTEIPRTVAKTLTLSSFAGFGTFSSGLSWTGPAITACYWISTGIYFLPVVGLSRFWGKAQVYAESGTGFSSLEPQVRSLIAQPNGAGGNPGVGQPAGLQVTIYSQFNIGAGGALELQDWPFMIALYGQP